MDKPYTDADDQKVTLEKLCRLSPSWAVNRIRDAYNTMECIEQLLDSGDRSAAEKVASHSLHGGLENVMRCRIRVQERIRCERCGKGVMLAIDGRCQDCAGLT